MTIVNHVGLRVGDLARSTQFYEALGFEAVRRLDLPDEACARLIRIEPPVGLRVAYLVNGPFVLELLDLEHRPAPPVDRSMADTGLTHLSLGVEDLDAAKATVVAHGGEVLDDSDMGVAVFVRDPDGQLIELLRVDLRPVTPA